MAMILVTGGAGFIGSNLLAGLEAAGYKDLVVCDYVGTGNKWRNLAKREIADFVLPENLFTYMDEYKDRLEVIIHLGGITDSTADNADAIIASNFTLARNLWNWCARNKKRMIYASAGATYGDGSQGFDDDGTPDGLAKLKPINPYGWSKHLFDRRVARLVSQGKPEDIPQQWVGLKFFTVYGPNEYHRGENRSLVCKLYPKIIAGARVELFKSHNPKYEDGGQKRDFTWIGDCVSVILWFLENPEKSGLFNVGTGEARSYKDLATATFKAVSKDPEIRYVDMPLEIRDKYQYFTEAKISKLHAAGYDKPMMGLEAGIRTYVHDYLAKDDIYL